MSSWHVALAYALTGERLALPEHDRPEPQQLLAELAALGWSGERLAEAARHPHPLPDDLRAGLGAAQLWAALAQVRQLAGASGQVPTAPTTRRTLTADERRLAADRPPHWG